MQKPFKRCQQHMTAAHLFCHAAVYTVSRYSWGLGLVLSLGLGIGIGFVFSHPGGACLQDEEKTKPMPMPRPRLRPRPQENLDAVQPSKGKTSCTNKWAAAILSFSQTTCCLLGKRHIVSVEIDTFSSLQRTHRPPWKHLWPCLFCFIAAGWT